MRLSRFTCCFFRARKGLEVEKGRDVLFEMPGFRKQLSVDVDEVMLGLVPDVIVDLEGEVYNFREGSARRRRAVWHLRKRVMVSSYWIQDWIWVSMQCSDQ